MESNITMKLSNSKFSTNELVRVRWECYRNGRLAIYLDGLDGIPNRCASVNVEEPLEDDEIAIKDYEENEGTLADLIEAGLVEDTGRRIKSGFVEIPVARLLVEPKPENDPRVLWREAFGASERLSSDEIVAKNRSNFILHMLGLEDV